MPWVPDEAAQERAFYEFSLPMGSDVVLGARLAMELSFYYGPIYYGPTVIGGPAYQGTLDLFWRPEGEVRRGGWAYSFASGAPGSLSGIIAEGTVEHRLALAVEAALGDPAVEVLLLEVMEG